MENILTFNQSIFGTKLKERRTSRRALRSMCKELYVPTDSNVVTYGEEFDIDGGQVVGVDLTVTLSVGLIMGLVAGTAVKSIITLQLTALASASCAAFGGPVGIGIGAAIGVGLAGFLVSKLTQYVTNTLVHNWGGNTPVEYKFDDVISVWIPFRKKDITINIGSLGI